MCHSSSLQYQSCAALLACLLRGATFQPCRRHEAYARRRYRANGKCCRDGPLLLTPESGTQTAVRTRVCIVLLLRTPHTQGPRCSENSPIFRLRGFNNWVKSVLIGLFCTRGAHVFDLCGGKGMLWTAARPVSVAPHARAPTITGGDLQKFRESRIGHLVLADGAAVSVEHALERYQTSQGKRASHDGVSLTQLLIALVLTRH